MANVACVPSLFSSKLSIVVKDTSVSQLFELWAPPEMDPAEETADGFIPRSLKETSILLFWHF